MDWDKELLLIHFQGHYLDICESEYRILQTCIQKIEKTDAAVKIGGHCLVKDVATGCWYRGSVNDCKDDMFEVYLLDHGDILSVDIANISSGPNELFSLPPKIICGFLANMLLHKNHPQAAVHKYLSNLVGESVKGSIQAILPRNVLLFEAPDINFDLINHEYGRHVDTNTFLLLFEMLTKVPFKKNMANTHCPEFYCKQFGWQANKDILSLQVPRLTSGTRTKVRVSAAVNPGHFYCQMASEEKDLLEMSKRLSAVCEDRTKQHTGKCPKNLGLLCSAKGRDGNWYRGLVQYLPVSSQVIVLFIDYGFSEPVKVENIRKLPPDFDSVPIMALPCSLFSLSHQDEEVRTEQLSFLKEGLLGRVLDVEIKGFDQELHLFSITVTGVSDPLEEQGSLQVTSRVKVESDLDKDTSPCLSRPLHHEMVVCRALEKSLAAEDMQVGSIFMGHVLNVENPNCFWIQTQKCSDDFEDMMHRMTDHFRQKKLEEDVLLNPKPGDQCCAMYEKDKHFYRAVVTDTLKHGAEVHFIDFGNTEKVPHMGIKKMPETFANKAPFAFCCSLDNVCPFGDIWTQAASDFFRGAVLNRTLQVRIVQIRKNKCLVDLHKIEDDNKQSISELLNSSRERECRTNKPFQPAPQNTMTSDYWEKEKKPSNDNDIDKSFTSDQFKMLNIIPGYEFFVRCSSINSPTNFWCQRLDKTQVLEKLMENLQLYYSTHTVALTTGNLCCVAKSPTDGKWYRAYITEQWKDGANVVLVDYGSMVVVKRNSLQALMPEYSSLEAQAFRCSLYDLTNPKNCGNWNVAVYDKLVSVLNKPNGLKCRILCQLCVENKGMCSVVDLSSTTNKKHNIRDWLEEQGLAIENTTSTKHLFRAFPETFVFSSHDLRQGKKEQMFVTHISSLWDIYCHLERNFDVIEKLEEKISEERENMVQAGKKADAMTKLCLVKYCDGKWYRGVAKRTQSPLYLNVFFVDYGNIKLCETSQVLFIPRDSFDLLSIPMQAVRCSLSSVPKRELHVGVQDWLDNTVLNQHVTVHIVKACDDGSFSVKLFSGQVNINDEVQKFIQSLSSKPELLGCTNAKQKSTRIRNKMASSSQSKPCKATRAVNVHPKKRVGASDPAQKKTELKKEKMERTESCVPAQPREDPKTARLPKLSTSRSLKVTKGLSTTCFVSHVDSVDSFFLQLPEDEPAILKMGEDLNSDRIRDSLNSPTSILIGDLVLAEYEEDAGLYRCVVKACEAASLFTVEFVDYGNSVVVEKGKIYSIPEEYLAHHRFSIPCSLLDTSAYKDLVSFTDAIMDKPLMVEFVSQHGSHWKVKVLDGAVGPASAPEAATQKKVEDSAGLSVSDTELSEQNELQRETCETVDGGSAQKPDTRSPVQAVMVCGVQAGDKETCTVLYVRDEHRFYVRLNKAKYLVSELERCIAENVDKYETVPASDVKPGFTCLVRVKQDTKWYRAVVQCKGCEKCQVLLVDDGRKKTVLKCSLRKMGAEVWSIQHLAVPCMTAKEESRTPTVGQEIQVVFSSFSEESQFWDVSLVSSPQQNQEALQSQDEDLVARGPGPEPGLLPQRLHCSPVALHTSYNGLAAAVLSPAKFCVILDDLLLVMQAVLAKLAKLDKLPDTMSPLPAETLAPGSCCLFRSHTKGRWCRAEIEHCGDPAAALVLNLVDYGHSECLAWERRSELRAIPKDMMELPKVAYPCVLRGVRPAGRGAQWTDEAAIFFQEAFDQGMLQIVFRELLSNTHWEVDVLVNDVDVALALVDAGHAMPEPKEQR